MLQGGVGNQHPAQWSYESEDASTAVDADGYITNGKKLGMKVGDIVYVTDTNASPLITTTHIVTAVNSDNSVDLSDLGATVGSTDSD
jgi:hypothetical protein